MYRQNSMTVNKLIVNNSYEGEPIELKIKRITNNKEPITDGAPLIYTDRKDGVQPEYDIRTDRWELAVDAMDLVTKTTRAKREEAIKTWEEKNKDLNTDKKETKIDGGPESTNTTETK